MTRDRIAELRLNQDALRSLVGEVEPPAVCFLADQDSVYIKGNESGLIHFALELLEVASGGQVHPATSEWIGTPYLPLEGIVLDPDPKLEVPKQTFWSMLGAYSFLTVLLGFLAVGAIVSISWVVSHFAHLVVIIRNI